MTLFTPNYSFPYAEGGDQPNGPAQEQALAASVDTALKATDNTAVALAATVTGLGTPTVWTPTFTGMNNNTSAAGTTARYIRNGKNVFCTVTFVPAVADLGVGQPALTLPFTAGASIPLTSGLGRLLDAAGANRPLWVAINPGATTALVLGLTAGLLYTTPGGAGYSWNASSKYDVTFEYECA